jgi:hypothetical protein
MFKLTSTAIVALFLATRASARICKIRYNGNGYSYGNDYRDEDDCSYECQCMDYAPSDATNVEITVSKLGVDSTCFYGSNTVISKFQLSNQNDESAMSGSLDNLLPASYCVKATLTGERSESFVDSSDYYSGCGISSGNDNILFQGQSEVTIEAGETSEVRLIMTSCAPPFTIEGYYYPTFPSTVVKVSTTFERAQGSVLGKDGNAFVQFSVENHNFLTPGATHKANKVVVTTDNSGQFDVANNPAPFWSLCIVNETVCDNSTVASEIISGGSNSDDDDKIFTDIIDMEGKESGVSQHELTLTVEGASKYATASALIETFAYDASSYLDDMAGSKANIDFVINPVGDLDIQIATATAVRPKIHSNIFAVDDHTTGPGHYQQVLVTKKDGSACEYADQVQSSLCDGDMNCESAGYVVPSDGKSTFLLKNEYTTSSIGRQVKFAVVPKSTFGSDCDHFDFHIRFPYLYEEIPEFTDIPASSGTLQSATVPLDIHLMVNGTDIDESTPHGYCTVEVDMTTSFDDNVVPDVIYKREVTFAFIGSQGCDNFDPAEPTQFALNRDDFCPALSIIEWGSTDHWNVAPACTGNVDDQASIEFCAFTSAASGAFPQPMYSEADFSLQFYDADNSYAALTYTKGIDYNVSMVQESYLDDYGKIDVDSFDESRKRRHIDVCDCIKCGEDNHFFNDGICAFSDGNNAGCSANSGANSGGCYTNCASGCDCTSRTCSHTTPHPTPSPTHSVSPCQNLLNDEQAVQGMNQIMQVRIDFINAPPLCGDSDSYGVVVTATNKGSEAGLCTSTRSQATFSSDADKGSALFCRNKYDQNNKACVSSVRRRSARSLLQTAVSGCPEDSLYKCPAENNMPFQINIEDGRLTVSMNPAHLEGKTVTVQTDPRGMLPTRSRFIASDFNKYFDASSQWTTQLKVKVDQLLVDDYLKQNLKPGVTVDELMSCCSLSVTEAESVKSAMDSIVAVEKLQAFKPRITVSGDSNSDSDSDDATSKQTTSTTSTSTTSEKSDSSLVVVVAVAGILVLVAVIALIIFTMKSNQQSQRVVDLRGSGQQSSWQKGGAIESDF